MRPRSIFYGWWLSGLAGMVMVISAVPVFHGMAVWSVALRDHFGWSATQLGAALSLTRAEGALMGPVEGYLADKLGTRKMVLIGLLVLVGAFALFSQVNSLWVFYLAFIFMSPWSGPWWLGAPDDHAEPLVQPAARHGHGYLHVGHDRWRAAGGACHCLGG